jgi:hypothetical protein
MGVHVFNPNEHLRYVSPASMVHNATDFTDVSAFKVTGKVTYAGGNYPVEGCSFEIDDRAVTKPNGELEKSDLEGGFTISIPIGIHKVRVVKQGHTFDNDGYLQDEITKQDLNYNAPINNVKFFDQTRVKLIGRVVGGRTEYDKPLGFGESRNNIGVQTIELQSTINPNYKFTDSNYSENFLHNNGQWRRQTMSEDTTKVDYAPNRILIHPSRETGEFVAMLYPEPYNIQEIFVQGDGLQVSLENNSELLDLSMAPVPDDSFLQTSIRIWKDSVFVTNQPGVQDYWDVFEVSDTVRYHDKWSYYYQAKPTLGVEQTVNGEAVNYFGDKEYQIDETTTIDLVTLAEGVAPVYLFDNKPVFRQGEQYRFLM